MFRYIFRIIKNLDKKTKILLFLYDKGEFCYEKNVS